MTLDNDTRFSILWFMALLNLYGLCVCIWRWRGQDRYIESLLDIILNQLKSNHDQREKLAKMVDDLERRVKNEPGGRR